MLRSWFKPVRAVETSQLAIGEPTSFDAKTGAARIAGIANGSSEGRPRASSLVRRAFSLRVDQAKHKGG
jgi:hypothetical protein